MNSSLFSFDKIRPHGGAVHRLAPHPLNLRFERLVLPHLAAQETGRQIQLLCNTQGREHIDVAKLVLGLAEVLYLDPALTYQCSQAVIHPTGTQPQAIRNFALGEVWVFLQQAQHPEVGVFLELRAARGHEGEGR